MIKQIGNKFLLFNSQTGDWAVCESKEEADVLYQKYQFKFNTNEKYECIKKRMPVMFTFHITNKCNLQCKYCYSNCSYNDIHDMPFFVFERTVDLIAKSPAKKICIDFHGGEPLLCFDFIKKAVQYIEGNLNEKNVTYLIQTNATLIDKEICTFLKKYNFSIGISLDGPQKLHNKFRTFYNGRGSFDLVLEGIAQLREYKIPFSVIAVVTNYLYLEKCYDFFRSQKIRNVKFIPLIEQGRAKGSLISNDLSEYGKKEASIFERMLNEFVTDKEYVFLQSSFYTIRKMLLVDDSYMCMRDPCGAGIELLSISENGDIMPCDSMSGVLNIKALSLGNVFKIDDFQEIHNKPTWDLLTRKTIDIIEGCRECIYKSICCGGCKSDVYNTYNSFNYSSPLCSYYKTLLDEYYRILTLRTQDILSLFFKYNEVN